MAAAAIFNLGKMSITLEWIKISWKKIIWEDAPRPCGDNHVTIRNRKLMRVTSPNEGLKHMCVDLSDYNIYLNQIWQRTQIPHYQHTGMACHINWKSKMAAAAIFNFGKMSITLDWIKISWKKIIWEDAPRPCGDDHVIKIRNRKLIRVTSSNKGLKHMCVDLSDYNTYLNQIWQRTQIPHCQHTRMAKFT